MAIGKSWPHSLETESVDNLSPGVAEVARTLAGRARWLYEMAAGESGVSTEPPFIPVNPQGLYGVDHSGPPYGVALVHSIFETGRGISAELDAGYWVDATEETLDTDERRTYTARVWCKPHVEQYGPYSYGFLAISAIRTGGSTVTVTAEAENITAGLPAESATLSLSTASLHSNSALVKMPLVSGWQSVRIEVSADAECYINAMSINQVSPYRDP